MVITWVIVMMRCSCSSSSMIGSLICRILLCEIDNILPPPAGRHTHHSLKQIQTMFSRHHCQSLQLLQATHVDDSVIINVCGMASVCCPMKQRLITRLLAASMSWTAVGTFQCDTSAILTVQVFLSDMQPVPLQHNTSTVHLVSHTDTHTYTHYTVRVKKTAPL